MNAGRRRRLLTLASAMLAFAATLLVLHPVRAHAQALGPCDIYGNANTPCVAAHSTVRALYASYDGPLYDVTRMSDSKTRKIGVLTAGGYANAALQDSFCNKTVCTITRIYDQSPQHNDLTIGPSGGNGRADVGARADTLPVVVDGHRVYGLLVFAGAGYRNDNTTGVARNGQPEGLYMVTSGTHVNGACCFDYGNAEVSNNDTGNGHMDAINFGTECWFNQCYGSGPWVQADMENGLFESDQGVSENSAYTGNPTPFVTAMIKNNGQTAMAIKSGDATQGTLATIFSGGEPVVNGGGYMPMHQEGAIILGVGGDNSNGSVGSFFEGVMTAGFPSDDTDNQIQANIVAAGYGGSTGVAGTLKTNAEISLLTSSPCCAGYYLSHEGDASDATVIAPVQAGNAVEAADATWIVRPGLADPSCLSFESRNFPGDYLRHFAFHLLRNSYDGTSQFEMDGTFCPVAGFVGGKTKAFQSFNYDTKYIRDYGYDNYVAGDGGSNSWDTTIGFPADASWTVTAPLAP